MIPIFYPFVLFPVSFLMPSLPSKKIKGYHSRFGVIKRALDAKEITVEEAYDLYMKGVK